MYFTYNEIPWLAIVVILLVISFASEKIYEAWLEYKREHFEEKPKRDNK